MKKIVLSVELHDERTKTKAMKAVSKLPGVESVSVDMENKKLTLTGDINPVCVVDKLRKLCHTDILSVGPAKEPEKKKEDPKKEEEKKKEPTENCADLLRVCDVYCYHHQMGHPCYCTCRYVQEDPSSCVIC